MRKYLLAGIGALALAALAVAWAGWAFNWHWGDVPTWVGATSTVFALGAAGAGAVGVFRQLIALKEQVEIQGDSLRLQREQASADRVEAERRTLQDLELRRAELRRQAERIDISPTERDFQPQGVNRDVFLALHIENNSARPIRHVTCRAVLGSAMTSPLEVARFVQTSGGTLAALDRSQYIPVQVVRRSTEFDFVFGSVAALNRGATYLLRFTDDAGLHWELTDQMHLAQIDSRDDW